MFTGLFNKFSSHTINNYPSQTNLHTPSRKRNTSLIIRIKTGKGVSPAGNDTLALARAAILQPGKTVLEIGTSTGLIALCLLAQGRQCVATDVNPYALHLAKENAALNGLNLQVKYSNLFNKVNEVFDLIIFNPLYLHAGTFLHLLSGPLEFAKSLVSRKNPTISSMVYKIVKKQRNKMITSFLTEAQQHLSSRGRIVMVLTPTELDLPTKQWKTNVLISVSEQMLIASLRRTN